MNYSELCVTGFIKPDKTEKVEKKIVIEQDGTVKLPAEDPKFYKVTDFDHFIKALEKSDSIYFDKNTGRYGAKINNVNYRLDFSDELLEQMEQGLSMKFAKEMQRRIKSEKVSKVKTMVNDYNRFPTSDEEIDLYDDLLSKKYDRTRAVVSTESKSVFKNFFAAALGAGGALCSATYVADRSWSLFLIVVLLTASVASTINLGEHLCVLDKAKAKKNRLKKQRKQFEKYLDLLNKEIEEKTNGRRKR